MSSDTDSDKLKELKDEIEVLDLWLTVASENGVFQEDLGKKCNTVPDSFGEAQECLKEVWKRLYHPKNNQDANKNYDDDIVSYCETTLSKVLEFYNRQMECLSRRKKFLISGGHVLLYLLTLLVAVVSVTLVYRSQVQDYLITGVNLLDYRYGVVLYNSTVLGFVAGILRGMYNVVHESRLRVFRRASWPEYVASPFIAGILAFVTVLAITAGLITGIQPVPLQEQQNQQQQQQQQQQNQQQQQQQPYGLYVFALASGLFWKRIVNILRRLLGEETKMEEREGKLNIDKIR